MTHLTALGKKRAMSVARAAVRRTASQWKAYKSLMNSTGLPKSDAVHMTREEIREGHPARQYVMRAWKQYTKKLPKGDAKKKFMTRAYIGARSVNAKLYNKK